MKDDILGNVKELGGAVTPLSLVKWLTENINEIDELYIVAMNGKTGGYAINYSGMIPIGLVWAAFLLQEQARVELEAATVPRPSGSPL